MKDGKFKLLFDENTGEFFRLFCKNGETISDLINTSSRVELKTVYDKGSGKKIDVFFKRRSEINVEK